MNKSTLSLFNVIQVEKKQKTAKNLFLKETIKNGYILAPEVAAIADSRLLKTISDVIGISGTRANNSFHKSWGIIKDTPDEILVMQQIIHYITTYGFERLGIYNEDSIYIPNEELKLPRITDKIKLVVVHGLTAEEILQKIVELGSSGIALKDETLADILVIVEANEYKSKFVSLIRNRELKSKLYDFYGIVPEEPLEFLRFVINKVSGESLLIKNRSLINKIKEANTPLHVKTLDRLLKQSPKNLAEIFFRYKPLFLALKTVSTNKRFFNRLRKDAEEMHKPLPEDFLNNVTGKLKGGIRLQSKSLNEHLEKVNIFRKIRLAYALKFRTLDSDSIVYRVRNGRAFTTAFEFDYSKEAERTLETVLKSIHKDLDVKGKTIFIPEYVNYALPATEKQFIGNLPTGSYVTIPDDMIIGIHWADVNHNRIDIDLSVISASGKTGWDRNYRSEDNAVLFSGDMTAAPLPHGATELFYIKKGETDNKVMYANYFNFNPKLPVPAKIIIAHEKPVNFGKSYVVNPNNILVSANIVLDKEQTALGLITRVDDENRFYFASMSVGKGITSYGGAQSDMTREFLINSLLNPVDFKQVLINAGAKIVDEKPKKGEYLDLSPEALDKTTFINLLTKKPRPSR